MWRWWQRGVVYQIYPRSFMDSNGDGTGDLPGITSRLDYLEWLGVDAIWISPIFPSPMADFGYDVSNYTDVEPLFGSLSDFDRLVDEAHRHDMRIILDYVPNHTSDQHPWFLESRASRDSARRDWHMWRDARPDGGPPNNWLGSFGGSGWEWDAATSQFYYHAYLKEQPDLNWWNPAVQAAMYDVLRFWLDRGVDGFRIAALPAGAWPNWVLGNHDRSRVASRVGPAQARVAAMLLLTLRGTPTLYNGDEIGMHDVPIPPALVQDPFERNVPGLGLGRDPERTPVQWDDGPHAGFSTTTPWLPLADDYTLVNVATQRQDPRSMLALHRQLIAVRRSTPALSIGSYVRAYTDDSVLVYVREGEGQRVFVAVNLWSRPREVAWASAAGRPLL